MARNAAPAPGGQGSAEVAGPREAVVGVLDKRLGKTAFFTLKPGERFRFGTLSGILRTCERTPPWEKPSLSAAFVQVVETPRATAARRGVTPEPKPVFSGWLFAESPSLNPVQHPVYDVWLKSCTMRLPEGPSPARAASAPAGLRPSAAARPRQAPQAPAPEAAGEGE